MCRDCNDLTMVCWAEFERQHEADAAWRDAPSGDAYMTDCAGCGQRRYCDPHDDLCGACVKAKNAPQGEAVRLFEPAPAQMPGQLAF